MPAFIRKEFSVAVFMALTKAFDTVDHIDHNLLLGKLERYGVRGLPLKLSFLTDRRQFVQIGNIAYECPSIRLGSHKEAA